MSDIIHGKKTVKTYRKSLSFVSHKCNFNTNTPKELGTTSDDVIDYVQRQIYHILVKYKTEHADSDKDSEMNELPEDTDRSDISVSNDNDATNNDIKTSDIN